MYRPIRETCLIAGLAVLGACSKSSTPASPPAAVAATPDAMFKALDSARTGKPEALWQALPPSYRKDVDSLIDEFATKMDAPLWEKGFSTFGKLVRVLDEKRDYVLGYPLVAMFTMGSDRKQVEQGIDATVKALSSVANSQAKTLDGLKSLDVGQFLNTALGGAMSDLVTAADTMRSSPMGGGDDAAPSFTEPFTTRIVSESEDAAVVEVTADGKAEQVPVVKVDGAWLPKEMVDGWAEGVAEARQGLATFEITTEDKTQAMMMISMIDGVLEQLLAAADQDEFNETIDGLQQMFGQMGG